MLYICLDDINFNNAINELNKKEMLQVVNLTEKLKIKDKTSNIVLILENTEIVNSPKDLKRIVKNISKIEKQCLKRKIKIGTQINNEETCLIVKKNVGEINTKTINELNIFINLFHYKSKREKIEFLYDKACEYLDSMNEKLNYCDFKDDVCVSKRKVKKPHHKIIKMGCCYHVNIFSSKKHKLCEYLKDKKCSVQCISCKFFTCADVDIKFKINDILYLKYYFNPIQKLIIKGCVLTPKEKIISLLILFSI